MRARRRVHVTLEGLVAVHAVRAVWTALAAVPGVVSADVTMAGAVLEMDGPLDRAALDAAMDSAGVRVTAVRVDEQRSLPLL